MRRLTTLLLAVMIAPSALAQATRPEPIKDNSFLVEEAYNQPPGVVQHISTFAHPRKGSDWAYSFTQEWPVRGMRHQLSFTVPVTQGDAVRGVGDVALNYRYQLRGTEGGPLAVAPRLSVLLPTGSVTNGFGAGAVGMQANLPVSLELGEAIVSHSNAGATWIPSARDAAGNRASTTSYSLGQSLIWLATASVNVMFETAWASTAAVESAGRVVRNESFLVSPGVRWAHTLPSGLQIVPGVAYPIGVGPSRGDQSLFAYLSFEHPF